MSKEQVTQEPSPASPANAPDFGATIHETLVLILVELRGLRSDMEAARLVGRAAMFS